MRNKHSLWTFLTDESEYATSARKLLQSARSHTSLDFDSVILEIASKQLRPSTREMLTRAGWQMCQVNRIPPRDELKTWPKFRDQFTKLQLWRMVDYKSIVYIDSDCLVVGNIDRLFELADQLNSTKTIGATRDIIEGEWQAYFNMGVFIIKPNADLFKKLIILKYDVSFQFNPHSAEQTFLNKALRGQFVEIGFKFNANLAVYSQIKNYWSQRQTNISIIHYTLEKPWWKCSKAYETLCQIWKKYKLLN